MLLTTLEIENFRSLEKVKLEDIGLVNILIGRNNSGKSSVFHALQNLRDLFLGNGLNLISFLTDQDSSKKWCMTLEFKIIGSERNKLLSYFEYIFRDDKKRFETIKGSSFLSRVKFHYEVPGQNFNDITALKKLEIFDETGNWATIWHLTLENGSYRTLVNNPLDRVQKFPNKVINEELLANNTGKSDDQEYVVQSGHPVIPNHPISWFVGLVSGYLTSSFFFSPHRRSVNRQSVKQVMNLETSGANLSQILHTLNNNEPAKFQDIAAFIKEAISDIGDLRVRLENTETYITFASSSQFQTHLHDMGGGVEQLLMVATALQTSNDQSAIFLEEPENHLHPSALHYLFDKLQNTGRQIFVATHESALTNKNIRDSRIFRVEKVENRTRISGVTKSEELSEVLREIGVRNSDVLMADAVLFVEGPSDDPVLLAWAETLGVNLLGKGISIVHMEGGETVKSSGSIRQQTLEKISSGSPVPHLFIIDRDQRSDIEIENLKHKLKDKIHIFEKRELENYFLYAPDAIWKSLLARGSEIRIKLENSSIKDLSAAIIDEARSLFSEVLVKRMVVLQETLPKYPLE